MAFLSLSLMGCFDFSSEDKSYISNISSEEVNRNVNLNSGTEYQEQPDTDEDYNYSWKEKYVYQDALVNRIPVPSGYKRIELKKGTFADWLRHIPLEEGKGEVNYFNGDPKHSQSIHAAVVDMDVGTRDLQQCADAIMRVKAEYHYQRNEYEKIHFNFTSGDKVSFDDWRKGKKPRISGNKVSFTGFSGQTDNSYRNFKKYLIQIFSYAGTASLEKELRNISVSEMQPGDLFIQGGSPGHAILVMDMAENMSTGEKIFMLAQSYMPAQDFHILKNYKNRKLSPWYSVNFGGNLDTPEWDFSSSDLYRFR